MHVTIKKGAKSAWIYTKQKTALKTKRTACKTYQVYLKFTKKRQAQLH